MIVETFVNSSTNDSIVSPAWALPGRLGFGLIGLAWFIWIKALVWHVYLRFKIGLKLMLGCTYVYAHTPLPQPDWLGKHVVKA